jgi:GT2 family glycosyltransferase/oligoribonuclease NrnB/cAMP/cGMP phosphodiesterase (DHH superfamily)
MATRVFYHEDLDGECSAALIGIKVDPNAKYYGCNYNKVFPIDKIEKNDSVWIVDFSVPPEQLDEIFDIVGENGQVVWIDHHHTSLEKYANYDKDILGLRNTEDAGCVLTWNFIMNDSIEPPSFVLLIGDFDAWHWKYKNTKHFIAGIGIYDTTPGSNVWEGLFAEDFIEDILQEGELIDKYLTSRNKERLAGWGFEANLEGYDIIALNDRGGSMLFGDLIDNYPFVVAYIHDGKQFNISLYSTKMDVRKIAEKYGGGGHTGACGFSCDKLPFTNIKPIDYNRMKFAENKPKFSIIIPTHNHCDDSLKPCIESIVKNTDLGNIEIIIIPNGCTDNTKEYVQSLKNPFKILWFDDRIGAIKTRNEGIKIAKGDYIILLDSDCLIMDFEDKNRWIERLYEPFIKKENMGITGVKLEIHPTIQFQYISFFCVMISRKVFEKIGYLDEIFSPVYCEDVDFCVRLADNGYEIAEVTNHFFDENHSSWDFPIIHMNNKTQDDKIERDYLIKQHREILKERYGNRNNA